MDDVEGTAECLFLREAENSGGATIPPANHALGIRIDDRIRHAGNEAVGELRWVKLMVPCQTSGCVSIKRG
jgi:hypothetical protein